MLQRSSYLIICLLISFHYSAKSITDAYEALKIYNYFEAKRLFYKKIKKFESPSAYGLATIYFRKDNPFHNIDSAYKYAIKADESFSKVSNKTLVKLQAYEFNQLNILDLKRKISSIFFQQLAGKNSEKAYIEFLEKHPWATERYVAQHRRDSLAFYDAMRISSVNVFNDFLKKYPDSEYAEMAKDEIFAAQYRELTSNQTLAEYMRFIEEHSDNPYSKEAENAIFKMQTSINTIDSYKNFIHNFPANRNVELAWRRLYQIYMYKYSKERIEQFKRDFPDYPFKNELQEDENLANKVLYPYKKDNYYGWMSMDGTLETHPEYDGLNFFKEGLAQASKFGKIGFVDKNNRVVIPFEYDEASDFEDGRAMVEKNGKMGVIDRSGKLIFPLEFEDIGLYSEGLVYAKKDSLFGYYDKFGTLLIAPRFDEAFSFKDGFAQVVIGETENYIDRFGNLLFPLEYTSVNRISEHLFVFEKGDYFGLINSKAVVIQPAKFDEISTLSEGKIAFNLNGKVGYFDQSGTILINPTFEARPNLASYANFNAGYARAFHKNKCGLIGHDGKWVISPSYQKLGEISELIAFYKDILWGYIDLNNKIVVPPTYDEAHSFENGVAIVSFNNRYGLMDTKGQLLIPIIHDHLQKLTDKLFVLKNKESLTLIGLDGKALTETTFKQIRLISKDFVLLVNDQELQYFYIPEMRFIKVKE